jgi:hypothetical protein
MGFKIDSDVIQMLNYRSFFLGYKITFLYLGIFRLASFFLKFTHMNLCVKYAPLSSLWGVTRNRSFPVRN